MKKTIFILINLVTIISGCCGDRQSYNEQDNHTLVETSEYRYGEFRYVRYMTASGQTISGNLYLDTFKTYNIPYEGFGVTTLEVVCEYKHEGHTFLRFKTSDGQTISGIYHDPYCKAHHLVGIR